MEVKAAAHSPTPPHYAKRWDAISPKDPFYSTAESWRDRHFSGLAASTHAWSDTSTMSVASSSSPSLSSVLPVDGGVVDKVLYHNLVEMIPLVETLMLQEQQQSNKSFPRHASLVYTPNPRDAMKVSEHASRPKKGRSQLFRDNQVDQNMHSNAMIVQLQDQMEQLEQKLLEKDNQLQAMEASARQAALLEFQAREEELQEQILLKEMEIEKAINRLSGAQHEVESLHHLLEKAESDIEASNMNVMEIHEESHNLQCQVASLLLWMESIASSLDTELADEELDNLARNADSTMANGQGSGKYGPEVLDVDAASVELMRRKYLASLIAARHNPTDELLVLVAELRGQLQASLLLSDNSMHI